MNANLLTDPCIGVLKTDGTTGKLTLPGVFAALQSDEIISFTALLAHQAHPWHAFLCQLAAMVLEENELPACPPGEAVLPIDPDEEAWRSKLRNLTPDFDNDEPWTLVIDDLSKPAFMQPPVPERSWDVFNKTAWAPDDLDILSTSRNHGVKMHRILDPEADHWLHVLILLQTFSSYYGAGNYGNSRQFGGYASRPGVGVVSHQRIGGQWLRDVRVILENPDYFQAHPFDRTGLKLLWLEPWDGTESLDIDQLHPLFLEVSRRVRLASTPDGVLAYRGTTKTARVAAKELKGNLADPWIPVRKDGAALNSAPAYRTVHRVLFDDREYKHCLLQDLHGPDMGHKIAVRFRFLKRVEGGTDGYHERLIPIPEKAQGFAFTERRADAAEMSKVMVDLASKAQWKVLKPALLQYMQAARDQLEFNQPETSSWADSVLSELDRVVDEHFFTVLWNCLELLEQNDDYQQASRPWREFLETQVREYLESACARLPAPSAVRYRALAMAEKRLMQGIRKHLKDLETA